MSRRTVKFGAWLKLLHLILTNTDNVPQTLFHDSDSTSQFSRQEPKLLQLLLTDRLAMVRCMGMVEKFTGKDALYAFISERRDSRKANNLENFSRAKRTPCSICFHIRETRFT